MAKYVVAIDQAKWILTGAPLLQITTAATTPHPKRIRNIEPMSSAKNSLFLLNIFFLQK